MHSHFSSFPLFMHYGDVTAKDISFFKLDPASKSTGILRIPKGQRPDVFEGFGFGCTNEALPIV